MNGAIVLNIGLHKRYIVINIVLKGLPIRHKNTILVHIPDILYDIPLSDIKTAHPMRSRHPIFRTLN